VLDLRLSANQCLGVSTPSGDVEVCVTEVHPETSEATIEIDVPEEWPVPAPEAASYKLHQELTLEVPDGRIRLKVLRFRPRPDGTGGSVALGIDAPREWPVLR
jgi:hypothetical protein